jgi:hypothetical protein
MYKKSILAGRYTGAAAVGIIAWLVCSILLASAGPIYSTTTADFDFGIKTDTTTITDRYAQDAGTLELDFPYADKDPSLVSYWRFEGDMTDETGANDGTAGVAAYASGKFDQANNRDAMTVANDSSLQPGGGSITISLWFSRQASLGMGDYLLYLHGSTNLIAFYMLNNNSLYAASYLGADAEETMTTGTYSLACWYHVAAVYSMTANYWQIYVNGTPAAQIVTANDTFTQHICDDDLTIGNDYMLTDEVKAYNRALSAAEILALYNSGNQYDSSGSWTGPIIDKPEMDAVNSVSVAFDAPPQYSNASISFVDAITGAAITSTTANITANATLEYAAFDNGLLCTRGRTVKLSVTMAGSGNSTPSITHLIVNYEPGGAFYAGTQGHTERVIGAMQIRKGINRVSLQWTGPDVPVVRWDYGDGTGGEGMTTTHVYLEGGNYTITAIGLAEDGTRYWTNATLYFEQEAVVYEHSGSWTHITITNVTLFSSGTVMLITAMLYGDNWIFFRWNTPKLRMALGTILIFTGIMLTPGVLPAEIFATIKGLISCML